MADLVREPAGRVLVVVLCDSNQDAETAADLGDHLAVDEHAR